MPLKSYARRVSTNSSSNTRNRMERKLEYRFAPVELDGRTLTGIAVPWDSIGNGPLGKERFLRGAFGPPDRFPDFNLTKQHNRSLAVSADLRFSDSPSGLKVSTTIAKTALGADTLVEIREGILRGFSLEFFAEKERMEKNVRVISKATFVGLSLVDHPAYTDAKIEEVREKDPGKPRVRKRRFF